MKSLTFSQLKKRASDRFSYILLGCPNFPPATGTTTKTAFEKLIGFIDAIMEQTKGEDAKQWLKVCLQEVRQSWKYYEEGDISGGRKTIQRAEEHFNNAFTKKSIEPRFMAGETGQAMESNSGFPV